MSGVLNNEKEVAELLLLGSLCRTYQFQTCRENDSRMAGRQALLWAII